MRRGIQGRDESPRQILRGPTLCKKPPAYDDRILGASLRYRALTRGPLHSKTRSRDGLGGGGLRCAPAFASVIRRHHRDAARVRAAESKAMRAIHSRLHDGARKVVKGPPEKNVVSRVPHNVHLKVEHYVASGNDEGNVDRYAQGTVD